MYNYKFIKFNDSTIQRRLIIGQSKQGVATVAVRVSCVGKLYLVAALHSLLHAQW